MIDFTSVGFMTDQRPLVEFVLKDTLNSGIHPQETVRNFGSSIWCPLFESLVLIIEWGFNPFGIQHMRYAF